MPHQARRGVGAKYRPLVAYLAGQPGDEVALSFAQIAAIVGAPLPPSAYGAQWWRGRWTSLVQSQPWRAAGWNATAFSRDNERWVAFRRRR